MNRTHSSRFHRIFAGALLLLMPLWALAGEIKWQKFEAGFEEAKKSNKKIMVDVYTDWCGWCKKLDSEVYGNDKVSEYLSQQYVVIKLNAESGSKLKFAKTEYTEAQLAQAFGISGYPTIIFFDSNGEPLDKISGYMPAADFLPVLKYFGEDFYKDTSWPDFKKSNATVPPATP